MGRHGPLQDEATDKQQPICAEPSKFHLRNPLPPSGPRHTTHLASVVRSAGARAASPGVLDVPHADLRSVAVLASGVPWCRNALPALGIAVIVAG